MPPTTLPPLSPLAGDGGSFDSCAEPVRQARPVRDAGRVLIVDDDALVRQAFQRVLEGAGYRVATATDVAEAAVIGIGHPKWGERPLLVVVPRKDRRPQKEDILKFMEGKIVKWWMPDDVAFVAEIPHTATGKIQKTALRDQFRDYRLPTAAE